jgi:hypothetical protein
MFVVAAFVTGVLTTVASLEVGAVIPGESRRRV